jgi:hypothetical protein
MTSARPDYPPFTVLIYPVRTQFDMNLKHAAVSIQLHHFAEFKFQYTVQISLPQLQGVLVLLHTLYHQVHCTIRRYKTSSAILLIQWRPLDRKTC